MFGKVKRTLCLLLSLILLVQVAPVTQVRAQAVEVHLPEVQISEEILANDLFYLASTIATLREGANETYLLRVGRGGAAETESSVLLKISDMTACYGKDYTVSLLDGSANVEVPEDNCSLMELLQDQTFEQTELKDEDEAEAILEEDEEGMQVAEQGLVEALNYLADASGLSALPGATDLDPVQQARNLFTGEEVRSQRVTSSQDMFQQLQNVADVMTSTVPGATLKLTFAPGETEKYLVLTPKDNQTGDGDRTFYLILAETVGTTTNSAASSCAVTIADDEEQAPAVVRFSQETYTEIADGMVTVTVEREGALNKPVTVTVKTVGGTAEASRDYAEVDRELFFPFGITHLDVQIPVRTDYLTGEGDFRLTLEPGTGCVAEGEARVVLQGDEADTATRSPAEQPLQGETMVEKNLLTVLTADPINLEDPAQISEIPMGMHSYDAHNSYDSEKGAWAMAWEDDIVLGLGGTTGSVSVQWLLDQSNEYYFPLWYAGARITMETTDEHGWDDHHATILANVGDRGYYAEAKPSYKAARAFGKVDVDLYTTGVDDYCRYAGFINAGGCSDCNWLWIYSIKPILRLFKTRLVDADPMLFLNEDGSYSADTRVAVAANIKQGSSVVVLGDDVTITQPGGQSTTRYAKLSGLVFPGRNNRWNLLVAKNTDLSSRSVSFTLTKDKISSLFMCNGYLSGDFIENTSLLGKYQSESNSEFYNSNYSNQHPSYGDLALKPTFEYIDAKVTLENPYAIPVCYSISGTDYWIEPYSSYDIPNIHLGDTLALTNLRVGSGFETDYKTVGVNYKYAYNQSEDEPKDGGENFVDGKPIYFGGRDKRLCYETLVIRPNFTEKDNKIVVRVKTTDVAKFEKTGIFALEGTVNGAFTEYVFADSEQTIPGRIYNMSATPVKSTQVCYWTDYVGNRFVGNNFFFQAGRASNPEENVITLNVTTGVSNLKITGTLTYMDYNLFDLDTGGASARPVQDAVVVGGDMRGMTDEAGKVTTNTMRIPSSPQRYKVRILVAANGGSVIRDQSLPSSGSTLNITQTFSSGLSPVLSPAFHNVRVECDEAEFDGQIALDTSDGAKMHFTVYAKPTAYSSQITNSDGELEHQAYYEKPLSAQLVLYGNDGRQRRVWPVNAEPVLNSTTGEYEFSFEIPYRLRAMDIATEDDPPEVREDPTVVFSVEPHDTFYLRFTTDLLSETADLGYPEELLEELNTGHTLDPVEVAQVEQFTYSDVNTGLSVYTRNEFSIPVKQGLQNDIKINFAAFDLLGDVGMNLAFPVVNIGYMRLDRGYRMYIGISPLQLAEKIMGVDKSITKFQGDDKENWAAFFEMNDIIGSVWNGMSHAWESAFGKWNEDNAKDVANLGAAQWKFDLSVGVYFDFFYCTVVDKNLASTTDFAFSGIGGYVSANVGFKKAWYTIIPVVCIPAYIGVEINATVMGFFGVERSDDAPPTPITFEDATTRPGINFEGQFNDQFNWCVQGSGMFQLSLGVGLCGTLGIRVAGEVDVIATYEPGLREGIRDWGCFLNFRAGIIIDAFLGSIPLMYDFYHMKFGKFWDLEQESGTNSMRDIKPTVGAFRLRSGSEETSEWVGGATATRGAFTPRQTYTLVENGYEHAEPQLITLKNGTVVLAYLSNDPDKGPYQRTTLMLTTYKNGQWSEPVAVSDDGTADFQPSIAETGDGRVLLAWVSTEAADISEDTAMTDYLRSMEVFAAFAEIGEDGTATVGEAQRITRDQRIIDGSPEPQHYYDANPTVICDTNSGDAMVYYIKSGSSTAEAADLANPYVNDSTVCYLPYDSAKGKWMTDEFYPGEFDNPEQEQFLIDNFCGQRFLAAPTFEGVNGREQYAIPDFTGIGYDGLAVYAYTIDRDSSNDTDADKEIFLQVYSFTEHKTYYRIRLTDDLLPDAMPQLFRAKHADGTDESAAHTKLFWYRDGNVCYIDVTRLLKSGIEADGTLIPKTDGSGTTAATPVVISTPKKQSSQANQMANFQVAEDDKGRLYVIWTESTAAEKNSLVAAQEIFAMGYNAVTEGEENAEISWSQPYQLTHSGLQNDEVSLTLVGEDLLLVHNQYEMELTENVDEPLKLTDMRLVATTLAPCGSVVTENARLTFAEQKTADDGLIVETPVTLPLAGDTLNAELTVSNNGLTIADGYHVDVYAVQNGSEEKIWSHDSDTQLRPNAEERLSFSWTLPEDFDGMSLRIDTKENNYSEVYSYETEAFEAKAIYHLSNLASYQAADGFHLTASVVNMGNAATAEGEELTVMLSGPYDHARSYPEEERFLVRMQMPTMTPGESRSLDVPVEIPAEMLEHYGYIHTLVCVQREVENEDKTFSDTSFETLGDDEIVEFNLIKPLNLTLLEGKDFVMTVGETKNLSASMELADKVGGDEVQYSVADPAVAQVDGSVLTAVNEGTTAVYLTHVETGTTVSVNVTVNGTPKVNPFTDVAEGKYYYSPVLWAYYHDPQITAGTSDTTFSPKAECTREQVVTFLWNAYGRPAHNLTSNPFSDVKEGKYYYNAVMWAVENGITSGVGDGKFGVGRSCTREQVVTFLWKAENQPEHSQTTNPFTDVKDKYYYKAVMWAVENGITAGVKPDTFGVGKPCTRAEIVTFLYTALEKQ
ncbi:MAG: S-layer homology domain-containing protein [Oscillospiraceae bacterium]|nr:S-layer homology domain-containing protein [Oscillospiraceae bacterium]